MVDGERAQVRRTEAEVKENSEVIVSHMGQKAALLQVSGRLNFY
jgi:hypothetical protein